MNRRTFVTASGVALTLTIAGCAGDADDDEREDRSTDDDPNGSDDTETDDGNGTDGDDTPVELLEHDWYHDGQFDAGVQGRLENVSGEELSYVAVDVFFLDADDVQLEDGLDNTTDLAPDRVWEFDVPYLGDDPANVDNYEIETDVDDW